VVADLTGVNGNTACSFQGLVFLTDMNQEPSGG